MFSVFRQWIAARCTIMRPGAVSVTRARTDDAELVGAHLGADLAPEHINVNGIAPGFFPSNMTAHLLKHEEELGKTFPCGRLGNAEDAAGTAIYLCSRASAWLTGHTIVLDGGAVAFAG